MKNSLKFKLHNVQLKKALRSNSSKNLLLGNRTYLCQTNMQKSLEFIMNSKDFCIFVRIVDLSDEYKTSFESLFDPKLGRLTLNYFYDFTFDGTNLPSYDLISDEVTPLLNGHICIITLKDFELYRQTLIKCIQNESSDLGSLMLSVLFTYEGNFFIDFSGKNFYGIREFYKNSKSREDILLEISSKLLIPANNFTNILPKAIN